MPMDPLGAVLSGVGIGAFVLGIIEGPVRGWSHPITLTALIGGAVLLVAFVLAELRTAAPVLDPRLFKRRGFATGSVSLFLQFFAMFGFFFVAVQFLQLVLEYSALTAAWALMPMAVVLIPLATYSGTLAERYGHNRVGGAGLAISAVGLVFFATLDPGSSYWPFLASTLLIGIGAPLALTPATTAIVASLPREKQGVASAVNDLAREIGAAFGIAVLGSAFNTGYRNRIDEDLAGRSPELAEQAREAPAIALREAGELGDSALAASARDAFTSGMRYTVGLGAVLLVVGALYVWLRGTTKPGLEADEAVDDAEADSLTFVTVDAPVPPDPSTSDDRRRSRGRDPDDRELVDGHVDLLERDLAAVSTAAAFSSHRSAISWSSSASSSSSSSRSALPSLEPVARGLEPLVGAPWSCRPCSTRGRSSTGCSWCSSCRRAANRGCRRPPR